MLRFQLHLKIRHDSELSHHTLNCLIQLASLNGSVMAKREIRLQYLANYITAFLGTLAQVRLSSFAGLFFYIHGYICLPAGHVSAPD